MQIIQGIRDKGAAIVIGVIALSLIGFILMDAKQGTSKLFSASNSVIGKVNGKSVDEAEFKKKVKDAGDQEEQNSGRKSTTTQIAQIRDRVWNQMVAETVFYAEADKLGIDFTSNEFSAVLSSNDPSNPLMQEQGMIDSTTGKLNEARLREALNTIKKSKGQQFDMINARLFEPQKIASVSQKYMALLDGSVYMPSWMVEKDKKEDKTFANISYVAVPYNVISDSTIKVTDDEISKYVEKHKGMFKQEEGRMASYVSFSQLPSTGDSTRTRDLVAGFKTDFSSSTNDRNFLARNTSTIEYDTDYMPKSKTKITAAGILDSLTKLPLGTVIGPYADQSNYVLTKLTSVKNIDSVKARHILIATSDGKQGPSGMPDSTAKRIADSIYAALGKGADFAALAKTYSADGSKDKGGDLGYFKFDAMVPEFNSFCFNNKTGARGLVRTKFGYHIIEITDQKGNSPYYKIAYMAKEILASDATVTKASNDATKLSAQKDPQKFDAYIKANGLKKTSIPNLIKENDNEIGQLQEARQLVKWIFEANKGDVSDPLPIGDQFIVAMLDKVEKEGTQDVQTARKMAEPAIKDEKRGEMIVKKLGSNPSLENAAAAYAKQISVAGADSSVVFSGRIILNIGDEPRLLGAIFNKDNQTKVSAPILGKTGVYLFKVNSTGTKADETAEQSAQKLTQKITEMRNQVASGWFEGLRKQATIKDNRSKFY